MIDDDYVPDYVYCESCDGTGENPIEGTCLTCGGNGAVPNTKEKTIADLREEYLNKVASE